ncbi:hypothetical protein GGR57DRAFT_461287 [Xylariaceae sp. FL1272]|nr:hypothetical protein GGR57DRAFT_461287 [Xylariaceae sp. FL1272]
MANKKPDMHLNDNVLRLLSRHLTDKQRLDLALANRRYFNLLYPLLLQDNLARDNDIVEGNIYALAANNGTCALAHALDYADPVLLDNCLRVVKFWDVVAQDRATYNLRVSKLLQQCAFAGSTACIPYLRAKLPNVFNQPFGETLASSATVLAYNTLPPQVARHAPGLDNDPAWVLRLCNRAAAHLGHFEFEEAFVGKENVDEVNLEERERQIYKYSMELNSPYFRLEDACILTNGGSASFIEAQFIKGNFNPELDIEEYLIRLACCSLSGKAVYTLLRLGANPNSRSQEFLSPFSGVFNQMVYGVYKCPWGRHLDRQVDFNCFWHEAWCHTPLHNNELPDWIFLSQKCHCEAPNPRRPLLKWVTQIRFGCARMLSITKALLAYGAVVYRGSVDGYWANWGDLPPDHPLHNLLTLADKICSHIDVYYADVTGLGDGSEPTEERHTSDYDLWPYIGDLGEAFDLLVKAEPRASAMRVPLSGSGLDRLFRAIGYSQPDTLRDIATLD